jgi:hypothetical protein
MNRKNRTHTALIYLPFIILIVGIVFRLIVLLQNRNLLIDEVNVARNLYERSYTTLLSPLHYEQFAPPVFLWVCKWCMLHFGAYEWSLRLFPFVASVIGFLLFYALLKKCKIKSALFYPLSIVATGMIYVRYATELKQYTSDLMVVMALLYMALHYDFFTTPKRKFILIWILAGSVAIWLSMPSVFVLTGIVAYYIFQCYHTQNFKNLGLYLVIPVLWLAQFALYYKLLLAPSIQSDYLQNWHQQHMLMWPTSMSNCKHNFDALAHYFSMMGGHWVLSSVFNLLLLVIGIVYLTKKDWAKCILFVLPLLLLLLASLLHKFTLLPRVCLFSYPIVLLLMAQGFEFILHGNQHKGFKLLACVVGVYTLFMFNELKWLRHPPEFEKTLQGFTWIQQHDVRPDHIYVHDLVRPSKIYYTQIHPDSTRWAFMKQAGLIDWSTNMDALCRAQKEPCIMMYEWMDEHELATHPKCFQQYFEYKDSLCSQNQYLYYLLPKSVD